MKPTWCRLIALLVAAILPSQASADILVVSQNALRLGQRMGSAPNSIENKNAFIRGLAHWPGNSLPQVTFLQEVMQQANEVAIQPAGGTVRFGPLKGNSTYLERYGNILVNDSANHLTVLCHVDTAALVPSGVSIQRPPDASLIMDATGVTPQLIWFLNYHARFNGGMALRRAEVTQIGNIIAQLRAAVPAGCPQTTDNVVALGDWNLAATDAAFQTLATNAGFTRLGATPNVKTSLNTQGVRASRYDHFIFDDSRISVTLAALPAQNLCGTSAAVVAGVLTPSSFSMFRRNCSDHLGIAAVFRVR